MTHKCGSVRDVVHVDVYDRKPRPHKALSQSIYFFVSRVFLLGCGNGQISIFTHLCWLISATSYILLGILCAGLDETQKWCSLANFQSSVKKVNSPQFKIHPSCTKRRQKLSKVKYCWPCNLLANDFLVRHLDMLDTVRDDKIYLQTEENKNKTHKHTETHTEILEFWKLVSGVERPWILNYCLHSVKLWPCCVS